MDISGLWSWTDDLGASQLRISRNANGFKGVWVELSPNLSTIYGFSVGDWALELSWSGPRALRGKVHLHYPVSMRTSCPTQWDSQDEIELTITDGDTLQGRWHREFMHSNTCVASDPGWVPAVLNRRLEIVDGANQEVLQYHRISVEISAKGLPQTSDPADVTTSDPAIHVIDVSPHPGGATLLVLAKAKAGLDPVDVTIGHTQVKKALHVKHIDGAMYLVERFRPVLDSGIQTFEFDVSVQVFNQEKQGDPTSLKPIQGTRVALGLEESAAGQVIATSSTLDGLNDGSDTWLKTDGQGKVYCRVTAKVGSTPMLVAILGEGTEPNVQGRLGYPDIRLVRGVAAFFFQQPEEKNKSVFGRLRGAVERGVDYVADSLIDRNYRQARGIALRVDGQMIADKVADDWDQCKRYVFAAIVNSGVEKPDPGYIAILAGVKAGQTYIETALAPEAVQNVRRPDNDIGAIYQGAERLSQQYQAMLAGKPEDVGRALYAGMILGGIKGVVNAGYDQSLGAIVDLGSILADYAEYTKKNPLESAHKTLTVVLFSQNPAASISNAMSKPLVNEALAQLGLADPDEKPSWLAKLDPQAFDHFEDWLAEQIYHYDTEGWRNALTHAAAVSLNWYVDLLEFAREQLPQVFQNVSSYSKAIEIDEKNPLFGNFVGGYITGMGAGYIGTFMASEALEALATDGMAEFVKGSAVLERVTKVAGKVGKAVELANIVAPVVAIIKALGEAGALDYLGEVSPRQPGILALPSFRARLGIALAPPASAGARGLSGLLTFFKLATELDVEIEKLVLIVSPLFKDSEKAAHILIALGKEGGTAEKAEQMLKKLATTESVEQWAAATYSLLFEGAERPGAAARRTELVAAGRKALAALAKDETATAKVKNVIEAAAQLEAENKTLMQSLSQASLDFSLGENAKINDPGQLAINALDGIRQGDKERAARGLATWLDSSPKIHLEMSETGDVFAELEHYLRQMAGDQQNATLKLFGKQRQEIEKEMRFVRLPKKKGTAAKPGEYEELRDAFDKVKDSLKQEWVKQSGTPWPKYDQTVFKFEKDGKNVFCFAKKEGGKYKFYTYKSADELIEVPLGTVDKKLAKNVKKLAKNVGKTGLDESFVYIVGEDKDLFPSLKGKEAWDMDAHHVIPLDYGGKNEWWNLVPMKNPFWHQAGAHGAGSFLENLFEHIAPGEIVQLIY
jgi:hypothetical protein